MPDFQLAESEFKRQATILDALLSTILTVGPNGGTSASGVPLPQLPAEGQNTMVAAVLFLLAAHFEEFVRQQVAEYGREIIPDMAFLLPDAREKLIDRYWIAGTGRLARIRPRGNPSWAAPASTMLRSLAAFPTAGDVTAFSDEMLCETENNMRWDTVTELVARVGVSKLGDRMGKHAALKSTLNITRASDASVSLKMRLNEFYETRNLIAHQISQASGIGPTVFREWTAFFVPFVEAFSIAMRAAYSDSQIAISRARSALGGS